MSSKQQIISDIDAYMQKTGKPNSAWYVGIAADAKQRLFIDHKVGEKGGTWIYSTADSSAIARE